MRWRHLGRHDTTSYPFRSRDPVALETPGNVFLLSAHAVVADVIPVLDAGCCCALTDNFFQDNPAVGGVSFLVYYFQVVEKFWFRTISKIAPSPLL